MRKTIVYIAILGILGFGVWYFLFKDDSLFAEEEAGFTIVNTAGIGKVFLANMKGDTISITRSAEDDHWILNGQYMASPRMVEILMQTFKEQSAAYPVPEVAHNNVVTSLTGSAVKVEVFDNKGKKTKVFFVGGQAPDNKGTYMLMEGAQRPFVVQLPAYQGYITPRYSTDLADWRDRTWVEVPAQNLAEVRVQYADSTEYLNSFTLIRKGDNFDIELHPELNMSGELNPRRVKAFTGFFEHIGFEGYLSGVTRLDSIIASVPKYCTISVKDNSGNVRNVEIYRMRVNKRSKNVNSEEIPEFDADRYYGILNNNADTVILQSATFDKMFRKGYEFYQAD